MSTSTPADLAIAFRSLPRRLREASILDVGPDASTTATSAVESAMSAAARLLGCSASAESIASTIEQRHLDDWKAGDIDSLQDNARAAGTAIRVMHDLADRAR